MEDAAHMVNHRRPIAGLLYILPLLVLVGLFSVYPALRVFWMSMQNAELASINEATFIGFQNYLLLFKAVEPPLGRVLWLSFLFVLASVAFHVVIGFSLANLLTTRWVRGKQVWRTLYMISWVAAGIIVGFTFRFLFEPRAGMLNALMRLAGLPPQSWTSDPNLAMPVLILVNIWRGVPYSLIIQTAAMLDDEAIIATDVGQHQMFVAQAYPLRRQRQFLTSGGLGTMGFGLPAAIGAALAAPGRTVVTFSGDGSLLMNIQELATAVEENVNVKVIVMNNNSLGLVHQQQELFYKKRLFACDYRLKVDFCAIAEGFGMPATDLGTAQDPLGALAAAVSAPGPRLINAPIDVNEMVFPMVPPGAANRDMIGGAAHVNR